MSGSDPTGGETDWHYKGLNLIADAGDNASTLADFLHIDLGSAQSIFGNIFNWDNGAFQSQGLGVNDNIAGHILTRGDPSWLTTLKGEYGVSETGGDGGASNPRILQYFKATSLRTNTDQTPWCAACQNWALRQNNIKGTNSAAARSFEDWGQELSKPALGAIFVLPNHHHVTEFMGVTEDGRYLMLGGNQGDRVGVTPYKPSILKGGTIVYPTGMTPNYNLPVLNVNMNLNYKIR